MCTCTVALTWMAKSSTVVRSTINEEGVGQLGQEKSGWTHAFSGWITPGGMSIRLVAKLNTKPSKLPMLALLSSLTFPLLYFPFLFGLLNKKNVSS